MNEPSMWGYWRDKRGVADALKYDFPEQLASDSVLQLALAQIQAGEFAIEARMSQLADEQEAGC